MRLHAQTPELKRDVARIGALFEDGLHRFGGPFLAGARLTAVDAFFAPVAYRVQTYGLVLPDKAMAYVKRLLETEHMASWTAVALAEPWRDRPHDKMLADWGVVVEDLRVS